METQKAVLIPEQVGAGASILRLPSISSAPPSAIATSNKMESKGKLGEKWTRIREEDLIAVGNILPDDFMAAFNTDLSYFEVHFSCSVRALSGDSISILSFKGGGI